MSNFNMIRSKLNHVFDPYLTIFKIICLQICIYHSLHSLPICISKVSLAKFSQQLIFSIKKNFKYH